VRQISGGAHLRYATGPQGEVADGAGRLGGEATTDGAGIEAAGRRIATASWRTTSTGRSPRSRPARRRSCGRTTCTSRGGDPDLSSMPANPEPGCRRPGRCVASASRLRLRRSSTACCSSTAARRPARWAGSSRLDPFAAERGDLKSPPDGTAVSQSRPDFSYNEWNVDRLRYAPAHEEPGIGEDPCCTEPFTHSDWPCSAFPSC